MNALDLESKQDIFDFSAHSATSADREGLKDFAQQ
jgi:hypothetical protein